MDLLELLSAGSGPSQADILRNQRRGEESAALRTANQNAGRMDLLAAASQMAANPGAAAAAKMSAGSQREQFSPVQMGQQGFMLPNEGQFVESPMFADEKREARASRLQAAVIAADERKARDQERRDLQQQMHRDRMSAAERAAEDRRERHLESMGLRRALAAMAGGNAADRARSREERDTDNSVRRLGETLEKAGIPELEQALGSVRGVLTEYTSLPGYGRVMSMAPDFALSDEAQQIRSNMQMAANIILKSRSGAAVTTQESQRFLREVALGKGMSEAALRNGWNNVFEAIEGKKQNLLSTVPDNILEVYNSRSPVRFDRRTPADARLPTATPSPGRTRTVPESTRPRPAPAAAAAGSPPAGIPPAVWAVMPAEDRALFK
jgi:hypothetical protein